MRPRRELFADSSFFILNRAKKQMLAAGGDGHGQSHEAAVALVPVVAPALVPPPPAPTPAPGVPVLLQLQLRCHPATTRASDLGTVTVGASGSRREAWPQSQRVKDRGIAGHSPFPQHERVCEQTPHVPRSSKHDRARTRRWPHAQLQRPVRGPGSRKGAAHGRSTRREARRPRCGRAGSLGSVDAAQPGARQTALAPK